MSAGLMDNDEKLELARLRMLKDPVLAVITAPVDCPTAKQVRELRAAAGFVGWSARQVRATGTLHPMHRSLTEDRMHGGASTNAEAEASGDLIAERDFLANIVRSHETQILRMTDERAELLAKIEQIERLSRTADRATIDVASMLARYRTRCHRQRRRCGMSAFDICEGSHLEFAAAESAALQPTQWERWAAQVEKAIGHSLDGDNSVDAMVAGNADGYSLDDAYEAFEDGDTVAEYAAHVIANRSITHRFAEPQA